MIVNPFGELGGVISASFVLERDHERHNSAAFLDRQRPQLAFNRLNTHAQKLRWPPRSRKRQAAPLATKGGSPQYHLRQSQGPMECGGNPEGVRGTPLWIALELSRARTPKPKRRRRRALPAHSKWY